MRTPSDTLEHIKNALAQTDPVAFVDQLAPRTGTDAITWARRLPLWEDFERQFPAQVVALARTVSRRAMREFALAFDSEGRVVESRQASRPSFRERPSKDFSMQVADQTIEVRYTPRYISHQGLDLFSFVGKPRELPADAHPVAGTLGGYQPHALSGSGWWSVYAPHDVVEACGGPQRYARLYADARLRGEDKQLEATLNGNPPDTGRKATVNSEPSARAEPVAQVLGEHTARVADQRTPAEPQAPLLQRGLFG